MATNRKFDSTAAGIDVDLSAVARPGPSPDPSKPYMYLGEEAGWVLVEADDPEDRTPLSKPEQP